MLYGGEKIDRFDILDAISERKRALTDIGMKEYDALIKAINDISAEYHISLPDIKKLAGQ